MTLNEYQQQAMTTCLPTCDNFAYMMLNLMGELGEFAGKLAKDVRKDKAVVNNNRLLLSLTISNEDLQKEAGDILWQLSGLCHVMGWDLEDIAQQNLDKLAARKAAGTINGSGDGISGNDRTAE